MTVIRTGQQKYFSVPASQPSRGTLKEGEVWKPCKREICQRIENDEEAFVVLCLAVYVLQLSKENDVTVCALFGGMCHIRCMIWNEWFIYKSSGKTGQLYPQESVAST